MALLLMSRLYAQEAVVSFEAEQETSVIVYAPIEDVYNRDIPTDTLMLSPTAKTLYRVDVNTFKQLYIQFPLYRKTCRFFLFPNDTVRISASDRQLKIEGSNQAGQQFYYDNFVRLPFGDRYQKMCQLFNEYTSQERELHSLVPTIYKDMIYPYMEEIDRMSASDSITSDFANILRTQIQLIFNQNTVSLLNGLLRPKDYKRDVMKDSLSIKAQVDSLLHLYPCNKDILRYDSRLFVIRYLDEYFKGEKAVNVPDEQIFGPYKDYLHAPLDMQPHLLAGACLVQLKYDTKEMDLAGFQKFYNERFPNHPYTPILNERINSYLAVIKGYNSHSVFIEDTIPSLSALSGVQSLKGKYLFIDLWASWCMPCRGEFGYQQQLHQVLAAYKDIEVIYISIDNERQVSAWEGCIKRYQLEGSHLRASKELIGNLQKEIYESETITVPRYILLAPTGEILHKDLPRPSTHIQLKEVLDGILK